MRRHAACPAARRSPARPKQKPETLKPKSYALNPKP
jgi:hypothetical protein